MGLFTLIGCLSLGGSRHRGTRYGARDSAASSETQNQHKPPHWGPMRRIPLNPVKDMTKGLGASGRTGDVQENERMKANSLVMLLTTLQLTEVPTNSRRSQEKSARCCRISVILVRIWRMIRRCFQVIEGRACTVPQYPHRTSSPTRWPGAEARRRADRSGAHP